MRRSGAASSRRSTPSCSSAFSPTVGNLSDRFGRRPILLTSMAVMAIDYVVMALAGTIWLLFAGRVVAGIAASTHSTALAYMADITDKSKRAQNFGLISAGFGIGFILGPAVGGLLGGLDPRAPFVAAAILAAAKFRLRLVRPARKPAERTPPRLRLAPRETPAGGLRQMGQSLPGVKALLAVMLAYQIANFT